MRNFLFVSIPSCGTTGKLGLKWLSLAYQERPVHNCYQLGLYSIPVKPGEICILNMAQRQWGSCSLFTLLCLRRGTFVTAVTSGTPTYH